MSTEQVLAALAASKTPLKAAQVVEITGLARADVDKAFKELKKQGAIVSPKACFYEVAAKA